MTTDQKRCKNCISFDKKLNACDDDHFQYADGSCLSEEGLGYMDSEGYSDAFWVHEEFGCIHFKQRVE